MEHHCCENFDLKLSLILSNINLRLTEVLCNKNIPDSSVIDPNTVIKMMNSVDLELVEPLPLLPLLPDIHDVHDPSEILIQDIGKVKRNRGPGIKWVDIETENHEEIIYETFEDVLAQVDLLNVSKLGEKSKKVFIYKCKFKNCPYKIKFMKRYDAKYDSSSTGAHSHVGDTEDGGNSDDNMRGLDILQKKIVKEGFGLGIMSIAQILKYFRIQRAKREANEKFPADPDKRKLSNYVASLKKKVAEVSILSHL